MVALCSRYQRLDLETSARYCIIQEGSSCLACKEDVELEQKIQELQGRRRNIRKDMNANHDPFVLKLPPELGSRIFLLSMTERDTNEVNQRKMGLPTPFLLGAICRGWRQLARSTPELWTRLAFSLSGFVEPIKILHLVTDWLERSGSLPLRLKVSYRPADVMPNSNFPIARVGFIPIMDILNQHSERWCEINFSIPSEWFCGSSPPKNLRKLSVSTPDKWRRIKDTRFKMNTKPSPMYVTVHGIPLNAVNIALDNLVHLDLLNTNFDGVLQVIRDAPLLEICSLSALSPNSPSIPSETIIRHSHIRTLELSWIDTAIFTELINSLELPSLESWEVSSAGNIIAADAISFLKRSASGLKRLNLWQHEAPTVEDFESFLQAASHLQRLSVMGSSDTFPLVMDHILERISVSPPCGFLPDLQSLQLIGPALNAWVCIPLIFRWPHRKVLTLDMEMESIEIRDEISRTLLQLVAEGIDLRISNSAVQEDYIWRFRHLLSATQQTSVDPAL
jgi:hypothetical protein